MTYLQRIFIRNLLYVLLPVLICVLLTGAVFGQNYYQQTVETSRAATADVLTQSMDAIESWLNHVNTIAIELSFRKETYYDLMELFNKPYLNNFEKRTLTDMMATVNATMSANTAIKSIYVYLENDRKNFYATGEDTVVNIDSYYDTDWYDVYCSLEDTESLERLAREKYHMCADGEDVYIIEMEEE